MDGQKYLDDYLKSSNEYPLSDNRAKLIQVPAFKLKEAFEKGYSTAVNRACDYIVNNIDNNLVIYHNHTWRKVNEFVSNFRKTLEK